MTIEDRARAHWHRVYGSPATPPNIEGLIDFATSELADLRAERDRLRTQLAGAEYALSQIKHRVIRGQPYLTLEIFVDIERSAGRKP